MSNDLEKTLVLMERSKLISRDSDLWENGCVLWLPRGVRWKELIFREFTDMIEKEEYEPYQMPRIVPVETSQMVSDGLMDFSRSVYWLTEKCSDTSQYYLNSTTDPILSHFLSRKIRTNPSLIPFRGYFKEQLFRPHPGSRKPFVNPDENDVIEVYSINSDKEESFKDFEEAVGSMQRFFDALGLSYLTVEQPRWGNKPVAEKVSSIQTYLKELNCYTRLGSVYLHDDIFAKIFGLAVEKNGHREYTHEVNFGFGQRVLLTLLSHHRDEYGLCFTPRTSPVQVVIIPLEEGLENEVAHLSATLGEYRTEVDTNYNRSFQKRLADYLEFGVPVRIGVRKGDEIEYSRRDTLKRYKCGVSDLPHLLPDLFEEMENNYHQRSERYTENSNERVNSASEMLRVLSERKSAVMHHCGSSECGLEFDNRYPGEILGTIRKLDEAGVCLGCGKEAKNEILYGRRAPNP